MGFVYSHGVYQSNLPFLAQPVFDCCSPHSHSDAIGRLLPKRHFSICVSITLICVSSVLVLSATDFGF